MMRPHWLPTDVDLLAAAREWARSREGCSCSPEEVALLTTIEAIEPDNDEWLSVMTITRRRRDRICPCGAVFHPHNSKSAYCSTACAAKGNAEKNRLRRAEAEARGRQ